MPTASISTVAPICATPEESLTDPEIEPGATPAPALMHSETATANHPSIRVITTPPNKGSPGSRMQRTKEAPADRYDCNRYSTAKRTDGAICCFETLSSTFTVSRYMPG